MTTLETTDDDLRDAERRGYLEIPDGSEAVAARWTERCVLSGAPVVVVRTAAVTSTVEYDLTHLERRFVPWVVDAYSRWPGFAGAAYGMLRDVPAGDARRLAAELAARAGARHSTARAATCARLRRHGPWPAGDHELIARRLAEVVEQRVAEAGAARLAQGVLVRTAAVDPGSPAHLAHLLGILDELEDGAPPRRPAA